MQKEKIFISYTRRDSRVNKFAHEINKRLLTEGYEVFIDTELKVGQDWAIEIYNQIDLCDFFIVFLSEESMNSEMVQGEVRRAYFKYKDTNKPIILPVRMNYFDNLGYEMDSYLSRIHYAKWETEDDSPKVIMQILGAMKGENLIEMSIQKNVTDYDTSSITAIKQRPEPVVDLRTISAPGGGMPSDHPLYVQRGEDRRIMNSAERTGETIVIKAPRQYGKSSLLIQYLDICQKNKKRIALIDFSLLSDQEMNSYNVFLNLIANELISNLELTLNIEKEITSQRELTYFLENQILASIEEPIVISFDEVDRILGRDYQNNFFTMLRLWHNNRANPLKRNKWGKMDLALVISSEPYLLINKSDRSPFNVGDSFDLTPFSKEEYIIINERCNNILKKDQIDVLMKLLEGHPYLTRLAFFCLTGPEPIKFSELMEKADEEYGPFGDHLRALLTKLMSHNDKELIQTFKRIVNNEIVKSDDYYYRLHGAGLVIKEKGKIIPSNLLYARFYKKVL